MTPAMLQTRITFTITLIDAHEAALLALTTGGMQSYELDTGQSKQKVTKFDIDKLNSTLESLYNRCATMQARLSGAGSIIGRPGF